jgi:alanine-glyoxylate transaminase/(R)-3-amino-2-methylpropionate-pyruvate transaminase
VGISDSQFDSKFQQLKSNRKNVRGKALLLRIELVKDRQSKEPAKEECAQVMETYKEMGLLLGKGGLWGQTIRFSPPMCVKERDADFLPKVLDRALAGL